MADPEKTNTEKTEPAEDQGKKKFIKPILDEVDLEAFSKHNDNVTDQAVRDAVENAV